MSYLLVAPSLSPNTGEQPVSFSLNKAQLWGKAELLKSWCLCLTWPQLDYGVTQTGVHLYIQRSHPSLNDQYIIIKASLLHNGFDTMDQASETQFRGRCQLSTELSVLVQRALTNVYFCCCNQQLTSKGPMLYVPHLLASMRWSLTSHHYKNVTTIINIHCSQTVVLRTPLIPGFLQVVLRVICNFKLYLFKWQKISIVFK